MRKMGRNVIILLILNVTIQIYCINELRASPAARAIAYHTTIRALSKNLTVKKAFLENMTKSMLLLIDKTSVKEGFPIEAHLKASALTWENVHGKQSLEQIYNRSVEIADEYLSKFPKDLELLNVTFDDFEKDLIHARMPW